MVVAVHYMQSDIPTTEARDFMTMEILPNCKVFDTFIPAFHTSMASGHYSYQIPDTPECQTAEEKHHSLSEICNLIRRLKQLECQNGKKRKAKESNQQVFVAL